LYSWKIDCDREEEIVAGMVDDHYSTLAEHLDGIGMRRLGMGLSEPRYTIQYTLGGRK
jgi:hypothetical protein